MRLPTTLDLEALDWLSRRHAIRRSSVPTKFRASVRRMVSEASELHPLHRDCSGWAKSVDVVFVEITPLGRILASAYRHGRAALAPSAEGKVA